MAEAIVQPRPNSAALPPVRVRVRRSLRPEHLPAVILTIIALILRLHDLDHEPLFLDEGYTLLFAGMSLPKLLLVGGAHEHPPLYYLVVHALLSLHHWYLIPRVVSAVSGALSVAVIYALGARLFGRVAGLVAAALLTTAPLHLYYSQDGRGYALAGLLVLVSYYLLICALDTPRRRLWIWYAIALAATLYAEYTTVFVLLPQALLVFRARERGQTRPLVLAWLGSILAFLPWIGILSADAAGIASNYWIPAPTASTVAGTVLEFLGVLTPCPSPPCIGHEVTLPALAGHAALWAIPIEVGAVGLTILALLRRRLTVAVLGLWLVLPFVLVLALALRRSLYLDRIFLDATFPLYLLLGAGVAALVAQRQRLAGVVAALLAVGVGAVSVISASSIYAGGINADWKSPSRDFAAAYRPGQAVIFDPGVLRNLVGAYLPAGWHGTRVVPLWSRVYLDVPGWVSRFPTLAAPTLAQRVAIEARLRNVQFSAATRGERDVWLITMNYSGLNDGRRWLSDSGFQPLLSELYPGNTRIELWSRAGPANLGPAVVRTGFHRWTARGRVKISAGVARVNGSASLTRRFSVSPGGTYSVGIAFRGMPPSSKPAITVQVYDRVGRLLGAFPRTEWYDWPVTGVWLRQPFGFVAPPGSARATLTLRTSWGEAYWRNVGVYRERYYPRARQSPGLRGRRVPWTRRR